VLRIEELFVIHQLREQGESITAIARIRVRIAAGSTKKQGVEVGHDL